MMKKIRLHRSLVDTQFAQFLADRTEAILTSYLIAALPIPLLFHHPAPIARTKKIVLLFT